MLVTQAVREGSSGGVCPRHPLPSPQKPFPSQFLSILTIGFRLPSKISPSEGIQTHTTV